MSTLFELDLADLKRLTDAVVASRAREVDPLVVAHAKRLILTATQHASTYVQSMGLTWQGTPEALESQARDVATRVTLKFLEATGVSRQEHVQLLMPILSTPVDPAAATKIAASLTNERIVDLVKRLEGRLETAARGSRTDDHRGSGSASGGVSGASHRVLTYDATSINRMSVAAAAALGLVGVAGALFEASMGEANSILANLISECIVMATTISALEISRTLSLRRSPEPRQPEPPSL